MTGSDPPEAPPGQPGPAAVRARLEPLIAEGRLTRGQAELVVARLGEPAGGAGDGTGRLRVVVEAAGYLGAALVLASVALLGEALWADLTHWARLVLLVLLATALAAGGRWVRPPGTRGAADRLAGTLWALATGALAAAAVVAADWAGVAPEHRVLAAGAVALAVAVPLWRARAAALQVAVLFAAAATTAVGVGLLAAPEGAWAWAVLVTCFGLAWLALVWGGWLAPAGPALLLGAVAAAVGPQIAAFDADIAGPAAGVGVAAALIVFGVTASRSVVAAAGTVAATAYLLQLASRLLPGELGWMVGMLAAGAVLLGASLAMLRTARGRASPPSPTGEGEGA